MSERPLAVLDALGEELRRLGEPPRPRARLAGRTLAVAVVVALLLAAAATAAILITRGASLTAPNVVDLQSSGVPLAATARLAGLDAPDPDPSQPPWDIRMSRTRAGETCTSVGQVFDAQFGIVGLDRVFRALPLGGVDACGVDAQDGPILAGARVFVGATVQDARTVVNGVAGAGARSVTVYGPGGARRLRLGPQGSFITVYAGYVEEVRPRVVVVTRDGRSHTVQFAQSSAFEVADPGGGSAWEVSGGADLEPGAYPDENCAQASQELGRSNPSRANAALTPIVCGRLGSKPLFALMRRFVPGSGEHTGFPWGNNQPRTLVYGAAAPRVTSLTLSGGGPARTLPIDPHGGVFLAVLDGHVDPRSLVLTARLRDGATATYTRSTNLFGSRPNRPLAEAGVPAYRNPLPASQAQPGPPDVPIASTVRETLRAKDPAGGPEWALRSWQGSPNPRANFGGKSPRRFLCLQLGAIEANRLVEPRPGSPPLTLAVGQDYGLGGGCDAPADLTRLPPVAEAVSFVGDPYAYAPRLLRTVVSGLLRRDASHPVLLGAGAPRPLSLDVNRAFLAVLPGRYWDAQLRISATVAGHTVTGSAVQSFPGPPAPATPQARAPDPDGGPPWGYAAGANGSTDYGRILDGRFASIEARTGAVRGGPEGWSGGVPAPPLRRREPVMFETQGGPESGAPWEETQSPSRAQIERRTLPGRTIITGRAQSDVVSVTLATPRDVRTLRPTGPEHTLIVVYDGQFFRGAIIAAVKLRDGATITQAVQNGPGGVFVPPPSPSLSARLRSDEATLAGMRRQVAQAERAPRRERKTATHGAPLSMLVSGLRDIQSIVSVEKDRIAYVQAHPGALPGE